MNPAVQRHPLDHGWHAIAQARSVLGVPPEANFKQVQLAFRTKCLELQPDMEGATPEKFPQVMQAYQILCESELGIDRFVWGKCFDQIIGAIRIWQRQQSGCIQKQQVIYIHQSESQFDSIKRSVEVQTELGASITDIEELAREQAGIKHRVVLTSGGRHLSQSNTLQAQDLEEDLILMDADTVIKPCDGCSKGTIFNKFTQCGSFTFCSVCHKHGRSAEFIMIRDDFATSRSGGRSWSWSDLVEPHIANPQDSLC